MAESPKRRKYKDNPYTLNYIEEKNIYIITFKDVKGHLNKVEVSEEVYRVFDKFELQDIKELNEYDRHIEHSEIFENNLESRALNKQVPTDEIVENKINNEKLREAIQELPKIQRERLKKYYFENKTFEEIAKEEKCTKRAVKFSVDIAIEKISKKFKN